MGEPKFQPQEFPRSGWKAEDVEKEEEENTSRLGLFQALWPNAVLKKQEKNARKSFF